MTSKEAFKHIIDNDFNMVLTVIPPKLAYNNISKEEMISIIEKDLEVLEILKNKLEIKSLGNVIEDIFLKGTNYIVMFEEEKGFDKVKEWLENEIH